MAQVGSGRDAVDGASLRAIPGAVLRTDGQGFVKLAYGLALEARGHAPAAAVRDLLARHAAELGLDGVTLGSPRVVEVGPFRVVRFARLEGGLPVVSREVVVRLNGRGLVDLIVVSVGSRTVDLGPAASDPAALAARAVARLSHRWPEARVAGTRTVAFDTGTSVVRAEAIEVEGAGPHERALLYFRSRDGAFLIGAGLTHTARGHVYQPNPVLTPEPVEVELDGLTSLTRLTGRHVRVRSCGPTGNQCEPTPLAEADENGDFFYEPEEPAFDDAFAEVNAYFHTTRASAYFRETHDFEWTCCGQSTVLDVLTNFVERPGVAYDNAAYSPSACGRDQCGLILLGQGDRDFAYDGEVIYHEFAHGVVDELTGLAPFLIDAALGVSVDPGSLNEGTADYFAASLSGDPNMAEYFQDMSLPGAGEEFALRDLANALACPGDLFGEVHQDGRIWGGLGWTLREGLGAELSDRLMFSTLGSLDAGASLAEAGDVLLATAMAMESEGLMTGAQRELVEASVMARGLVGCEPIVPLDDLEPHLGFSGDPFVSGGLGGRVVPLHYRIDVPAEATRLRVGIESRSTAGVYALHVRAGDPVRYRQGLDPVADAVFTGGEAVLSATSDPPLPRCGTLFIAITAEDLQEAGPSIYEIRAGLTLGGSSDCPAPADADAGPATEDAGGGAPEDAGDPSAMPGGDAARADASPADGAAGGGCGCGVGGLGDGLPGAAVLFGLVLLGRRRRRRG